MKSVNPIFKHVPQFDWPVIPRAQWEEIIKGKEHVMFDSFSQLAQVLAIPVSSYQFYFEDGSTLFAGPEATFTAAPYPLYQDLEFVLTPDETLVPGLALDTKPWGLYTDEWVDNYEGADKEDIGNKTGFEFIPLSDALKLVVLNTETMQLQYTAIESFTYDGVTYVYLLADGVCWVLAGKSGGLVASEHDKGAAFIMVSHPEFAGCSVDNMYPSEFGEAEATFYVQDEEHNYLDAANRIFEEAKDVGAGTFLTIETGDGLPTALAYNLRYSDVAHVNLPMHNIHQFTSLHVRLGETPNFSEAPEACRMKEVMEYLADPESPVDHYWSAIMVLEKNFPGFADALKDSSVPTRDIVHSKQAFSLEIDRQFGKEVASKIGLNTGVFAQVKDRDEWLVRKHEFPTDKVAVKYNTKHFIGIFDKDEVSKSINMWLAGQPGESLMIEEYFGEGNQEFNLCYVINEDFVQPTLFLCEVNKILSNDTGGKGGNTLACHDARINKYPEFFEPVNNALANLHEHVEGVKGWVDLSFMVRDGIPYFTEWCIRIGCSNNATIVRQMETPLDVLLTNVVNKVHTELSWKHSMSVSVDIYSMPLSAGNDANMQFTDSLTTPVEMVSPLNLELAAESFFDPIDSAWNAVYDGYIVEAYNRYGTVSGYSTNWNFACNAAYNHLKDQSVLYGAYREAPAHHDPLTLFPFLKA
ncbi:hypothetical protein SKa4_00195 [Pseudomonas phage vB_PpuM-SKa-4]